MPLYAVDVIVGEVDLGDDTPSKACYVEAESIVKAIDLVIRAHPELDIDLILGAEKVTDEDVLRAGPKRAH